jgi:drug/metabolite transporter (DMT)-like permease
VTALAPVPATPQPAPPPIHLPSQDLGIFYITTAFLSVAVMSALGKAAGQASTPNSIPISTATLVFFQNFIALLIFTPWVLRSGIANLKTMKVPLHIVRALGGLLSQAFMFIAVQKMSLVDAVLLSNATPLFMPFLAWLWMKEKINTVVALSLLVGFAGVVTIIRPGENFFLHPISLIALGGAVFSAIGLLAVNKLSSSEPTDIILFYYFLISSVIAAPFAMMTWQTPHTREIIYLLGIGITMALAQALIVLAYRNAAAVILAPFNYSVVIFSGLIGWLVWNHKPDLISVLGVLLVAAGGIISTRFGSPNATGHVGWIGGWNVRFWRRPPKAQKLPEAS